MLEIGAGPGRFTQVLAEIGCRVLASDISEGQLELHRKYAKELGFDGSVETRMRLDVCDLSSLDSESFDAVVCYGGPLSYVFERAGEALGECVRVCRRGGHVLASVMSMWGGCHRHLAGVLEIPTRANRRIIETGDLLPENWESVEHRCHMFRSGEFRSLAAEAGLRVVAMSASNFLSIHADDCLSSMAENSDEYREFLRMETEACRQPGCLDAGTHIILVGKRSGGQADRAS